ncbi:uncharacterized protein [Primulina eburnea]|uniref:uncharacterized protein n=1 Tax=Primulina eburnea TaxID=1245227 RepID=UPI003C6BF941
MESTVRIELWHGGKFDEQRNNIYRGGKKFVIPDVDLDRFCLDDLFDMLKAAGGQQMNAHFFFKLPKNAFTTEMVQIVGDAEIRTMCKCFRNHSVITLWSQENYFTPLKDANIGVGSNPSDDTKAGPQVLNATDDNEGGTSESFGSDPIDDNHIGLDDVSIGDDEDSLDGSFHESDEDVDSESSTENDEGDEKATEFWYSDIEGSSRIQSRRRKTNASTSVRTISNQGTTPTESERAATSPPVSQHQSLSSSKNMRVSQRHPSSSQQEQSSTATKPPKARSCSGNSITARAHARASARTHENATASAMGSVYVSAVANASCRGKSLL